tara:strand:- start:707 stop:1909 length:1203 start_codon:yes stop_codon:yes gene_type:complete
MVNKKKILIIGGIIILVAILIFAGTKYYLNKESFSINTILLKLNIPVGSESISSVKVTNNEKIEQTFEVYFDDKNSFAYTKDKKFTLGPGQSKEVEINFRDVNGNAEIYAGKLVIETELLIREIPIILGVEEEGHAFVIIQSSIPKYQDVYPGGKIGVEIRVFNVENDLSHNVESKYSIKNLNNELILSEEENLLIKENFGIAKTIDAPETLPYGYYVFVTSIDYNGTRSIAGYLFNVSPKKQGIVNFDFFVIIISIFIIAILFLFFYFIKTRDVLILQLKKQQNKELERNLKLIKKSRKELEKLNNVTERNKKIKQLDKTKKAIIRKVKLKQKNQRKQMNILKKQGKKDEMKARLGEWKKQGFEMFEIEKHLKKISKKDMRNQVDYMRKRGYKTDFLGK